MDLLFILGFTIFKSGCETMSTIHTSVSLLQIFPLYFFHFIHITTQSDDLAQWKNCSIYGSKLSLQLAQIYTYHPLQAILRPNACFIIICCLSH